MHSVFLIELLIFRMPAASVMAVHLVDPAAEPRHHEHDLGLERELVFLDADSAGDPATER